MDMPSAEVLIDSELVRRLLLDQHPELAGGELVEDRKNGREKVTYPHESLSEVLSDTYGVIVYQEQVMLISSIIGGFTVRF